jgi:hypothetical protein
VILITYAFRLFFVLYVITVEPSDGMSRRTSRTRAGHSINNREIQSTQVYCMNEHEQSSITLPPGAAFERHFSVQEVSKLWGFGVDVIRRIFANEDGVIRIAHPETLHKRGYCSLRIPESVMRRVHRKLTQTSGKVN